MERDRKRGRGRATRRERKSDRETETLQDKREKKNEYNGGRKAVATRTDGHSDARVGRAFLFGMKLVPIYLPPSIHFCTPYALISRRGTSRNKCGMRRNGANRLGDDYRLRPEK